MIRLAFIGLGNRAIGMLNQARQVADDIQLAAVVDPNPDKARHRLRDVGLDDNGAPFFTDIKSMLDSGTEFDGAFIGTRCHLHTPMAVQLAEAGVDVPLFLEKPVAISTEQTEALAQAYKGREDRVVISFPLRVGPLLQQVLSIIDSGRLGTINQIQAHNNVSYGGVYFGNWYRDFDATGGLWLQKATHDFDYINALAGAAPTAVAATHSRTIYGGDKPENLHCSECDETETCLESPQNLEKRGSQGGMPKDDHACAFSESIKNQDAGSALLMYANGMHAAYSQNFVSRKNAGRRGARLTGYKASLEFDWRDTHIQIYDHHTGEDEQVPVPSTDGHGGGDQVLMRNFLNIIRGEVTSHTPLEGGLLSATMCLAARTSATSYTFQPIVLPGQSQASAHATTPDAVEAAT